MPRDDAIIFSDLIGKTDLLRLSCEKCGRDGSYRLDGLIERRGRDGKVIDWLDELTADCSKKQARKLNDPCGAKCPEYPMSQKTEEAPQAAREPFLFCVVVVASSKSTPVGRKL